MKDRDCPLCKNKMQKLGSVYQCKDEECGSKFWITLETAEAMDEYKNNPPKEVIEAERVMIFGKRKK